MALNKVVVDAHVEVDVNIPYYFEKDPEKRAKRMEQEARDIKDFLRDHRSIDVHDVYVVREYGYKCEHCGAILDKEELPECCEMAVREWATHEELVEFGYEEQK